MNLRLVFRVNEEPLPITDELDAGEPLTGKTCQLGGAFVKSGEWKYRGVGW
jgi:hypothetical protein